MISLIVRSSSSPALYRTPSISEPASELDSDYCANNQLSFGSIDESDPTLLVTDTSYSSGVLAERLVLERRPVVHDPEPLGVDEAPISERENSPVASDAEHCCGDTDSGTEELNVLDDESSDEWPIGYEQVDSRFESAADLLKMTDDQMNLALLSDNELSEKFFDDIDNVLTCDVRSDLVHAAKQLIANFAKSQSDEVRARIFRFSAGSFDLSGLDLTGMNFEGIDLRRANFSNANLSGANFSNSNLDSANFIDANLTNAIFKESDLLWAKFKRANLTGADFGGADLYQVDMSNAILNGAKMNAASVLWAKFLGADFTNVNFRGLNLRGAIFDNAKLANANFTGANLYDASFIAADLRGANFSGVDLGRVKFRNAILLGAIFTGASFFGADLSGADLRFANFIGINLYRAKFTAANLSHANFRGMNLWDVDLRDADLSDADLSGTNLANAEFGNANFCRTNLRLANLHCVDFIGSTLYGADMRGANFLWTQFGVECGVDSRLFVVASRNNLSFNVRSMCDTTGCPGYHSGLNIFNDPFNPNQRAPKQSPKFQVAQFKPTQTQPPQRQSFWGWISSAVVSFFGRYLRSVCLRIWGAR